jgi:hypothetical protein
VHENGSARLDLVDCHRLAQSHQAEAERLAFGFVDDHGEPIACRWLRSARSGRCRRLCSKR